MIKRNLFTVFFVCLLALYTRTFKTRRQQRFVPGAGGQSKQRGNKALTKVPLCGSQLLLSSESKSSSGMWTRGNSSAVEKARRRRAQSTQSWFVFGNTVCSVAHETTSDDVALMRLPCRTLSFGFCLEDVACWRRLQFFSIWVGEAPFSFVEWLLVPDGQVIKASQACYIRFKHFYARQREISTLVCSVLERRRTHYVVIDNKLLSRYFFTGSWLKISPFKVM